MLSPKYLHTLFNIVSWLNNGFKIKKITYIEQDATTNIFIFFIVSFLMFIIKLNSSIREHQVDIEHASRVLNCHIESYETVNSFSSAVCHMFDINVML